MKKMIFIFCLFVLLISSSSVFADPWATPEAISVYLSNPNIVTTEELFTE